MQIAIAVGSNRGDRLAHIAATATRLQADGRIGIVRRSRLFENPAVGGPPGQDDFFNGVWILDTALGLHQVLDRCRACEDAAGRMRSVRNGPRSLDLDLLLTNDATIVQTSVLQLPHPRLHQRAFVLAPLAEVAADWYHPLAGCRVQALWQRLQHAQAGAGRPHGEPYASF